MQWNRESLHSYFQMFLELDAHSLILPESVKRGKMLGRGAFGFVFKASIRSRESSRSYVDVALKMLQPVDPGFGAKASGKRDDTNCSERFQRRRQLG